MRARLKFVKERFDLFNRIMFDSALPEVPLRISTSGRSLGTFRYPRIAPPLKYRGRGECKISISDRYDLAPEVIEDTVIHEMIHYWIWMTQEKISEPHGKLFISKMKRINEKFGRNVTVRHHSDGTTLNSDSLRKLHYICISKWNDGKLGLTVVARTRIFEINSVFLSDSRIKGLEWYVSYDPWFNRFPSARTPKIWMLSQEDYSTYVLPSRRCIIEGYIFRYATDKRF